MKMIYLEDVSEVVDEVIDSTESSSRGGEGHLPRRKTGICDVNHVSISPTLIKKVSFRGAR